MAEFPHFPLFPDAYLADTAHLSLEEHGAYLKLLMLAWRHPSCSIPDDDKQLARMVGVSPRVWRRLRPTVMEFWTAQDGRLVQKRLTRERVIVARQRQQKVTAGKASARD